MKSVKSSVFQQQKLCELQRSKTPKKALKNIKNNVFKNLNHVERITNNYLKYHYILKTLSVNTIKLELSSLDHYPRFHHTKWSSRRRGAEIIEYTQIKCREKNHSYTYQQKYDMSYIKYYF